MKGQVRWGLRVEGLLAGGNCTYYRGELLIPVQRSEPEAVVGCGWRGGKLAGRERDVDG